MRINTLNQPVVKPNTHKLKRYCCLVSALLAVSVTFVTQAQDTTTERATKILREIDDLWRGDSSYGKFTMRVKTRHYTRTLTMEGWSKGTEQTLMRILKPLKEKGTATLKAGTTIYSYLPRTDRTIRLTSGMMMGSWMGSHFTNDDLVKESRMEEDYIPTITFEGEKDGKQVIIFELKPKPDAPVVWGKLELMVTKGDYLPVYEKYYDEDMQPARTMVFEKIKPLAGKPRPTVMRLTPADKPDEYTEFIYESLQLNIPLKDEFFSLANLKRY
ncbi:MAG: outer membrane lipoprotein-sorting protein [Gammaproteobacteria bacterium]|nr:outer membrane lipoprotein-sorting protein [Gammaproteobacteria bacterium]MDH5653332.1 outer membrane lipoprotein-sorting protein [Gammaproteobacteria bacterium]